MTPEEARKKLESATELARMLRSIGQITRADDHIKSIIKEIETNLPADKRPPINSLKSLDQFLTVDPDMLALKKNVIKLINEEDSVLIMGETGTGKELLAKTLHGERGDNNFIAVNCAALPVDLAESELFGHVRGAFSGAEGETKGFFGDAENGTIFLDEIGELKPDIQSKLLRVLQNKCIRKVGSSREILLKVRIVAASHHSLPHLVSENKFRKDLYARLSTIEFATKPLRNRRDDIKLIVDSLDKKKLGVYEIFEKKFIQQAVLNASGNSFEEGCINKPFWQAHELPLNVRDLQKIVRRYELFGEESTL